jgi:hypothetical protein
VIDRGTGAARCALPLLIAVASSVGAQSVGEITARIAPQFQSYSIDTPSNTTIREFSTPLFVVVPVRPGLTFDLGTAYARAHVEQTTFGKTATSDIAGLTDTQIRANYILGNDFVVLTAGVNLPTGQSRVKPGQVLAAGLIGSDFLAFPISSMGTGFGETGGVAVARPLGDWNVGAGVSMRRTERYDPFDLGGDMVLRYQPGNEYRARIGADRAVGTGRVTLGFTYSTFGNDELAGSIYNTGNRYITQVVFANDVGPGRISVVAWNLFRTAGTLADSSFLGHENIANAAVSYGLSVGPALIEPGIETRAWVQEGAATSLLTTIGVRSQFNVDGWIVSPGVGFSLGRVAAQDPAGINSTATLTGFRATLAIRVP